MEQAFLSPPPDKGKESASFHVVPFLLSLREGPASFVPFFHVGRHRLPVSLFPGTNRRLFPCISLRKGPPSFFARRRRGGFFPSIVSSPFFPEIGSPSFHEIEAVFSAFLFFLPLPARRNFHPLLDEKGLPLFSRILSPIYGGGPCPLSRSLLCKDGLSLFPPNKFLLSGTDYFSFPFLETGEAGLSPLPLPFFFFLKK